MNQGSTFSSAKISSFTDLEAWKKGHELVLMIYRSTDTFPSSEKFGLANQLRRAAVSITSNVAEGFSRQSYREKVQFYATALGSVTEVQNQIIIARDVSYIDAITFTNIMQSSIHVNKLLNGLIKKSKSLIPDS